MQVWKDRIGEAESVKLLIWNGGWYDWYGLNLCGTWEALRESKTVKGTMFRAYTYSEFTPKTDGVWIYKMTLKSLRSLFVAYSFFMLFFSKSTDRSNCFNPEAPNWCAKGVSLIRKCEEKETSLHFSSENIDAAKHLSYAFIMFNSPCQVTW